MDIIYLCKKTFTAKLDYFFTSAILASICHWDFSEIYFD